MALEGVPQPDERSVSSYVHSLNLAVKDLAPRVKKTEGRIATEVRVRIESVTEVRRKARLTEKRVVGLEKSIRRSISWLWVTIGVLGAGEIGLLTLFLR